MVLKVLGFELAPLFIPVDRRLQTLGVMLFSCLHPMSLLILTILVFLLFTPLFLIPIGYSLYLCYDVMINQPSCTGGRRWEWFRRHPIWRYQRDYFPAKIVKTADLDVKDNYLFAYHPHGILGCGAVCGFGTEGAHFSELYPGLTPHLLTLKMNFYAPLLRKILLWLGCCDVSRQSIDWILSKKGPGNAVIIVVGGAEEALNAQPGHYDILLKRRKGFVRQAVKAGASLVPVYAFGENELFEQLDNPEGSRIREFQTFFKKTFGFSPPLFYGRGVFNYTFGFLPRRKPISIVVGSPIPTEKCSNPDPDLVDSIHQKYQEKLSELFDQHKGDYGVPADRRLRFI